MCKLASSAIHVFSFAILTDADLSYLSLNSMPPKANEHAVFKQLNQKEGQIKRLVSTLMTLPASPVWIHEKHVHNALSLPRGESFGPYHVLSCLINMIRRGFGGNKKNKNNPKDFYAIETAFANCNFIRGGNEHGVAYQEYGTSEPFHAGDLIGSRDAKPRWFSFENDHTNIVCELKTQQSIVADAMGDDTILMDGQSHHRRKKYYIHFYCGKSQDGGYSLHEVPAIAYKYYHQLRRVFKSPIKAEHVDLNPETDDIERVSRRAFDEKELSTFESILRLMLVAQIEDGKMVIANREWALSRRVLQRNGEKVTATRSLTPPPAPTRSQQPRAPPQRQPRRPRDTIDSSSGSIGLPALLEKNNLSKYQSCIQLIAYTQI